MEESIDYDFGMTLSYPFPLFSHPKLKKATPTSSPKLTPKLKPVDVNKEDNRYNFKNRTRTSSVSSLGSLSSTEEVYTPNLSTNSTPRNSVSLTNGHELLPFVKGSNNRFLFEDELKEGDETSDFDSGPESASDKDFKRIFDDEEVEKSKLVTFTENTAKNLLFGVCVGLLVVNSVSNQIFNKKEDKIVVKDEEIELEC